MIIQLRRHLRASEGARKGPTRRAAGERAFLRVSAGRVRTGFSRGRSGGFEALREDRLGAPPCPSTAFPASHGGSGHTGGACGVRPGPGEGNGVARTGEDAGTMGGSRSAACGGGREPAEPRARSSRADVCFPGPWERRWCGQWEERNMPLTSRWGRWPPPRAALRSLTDGQGLRFRFQR